MKTDHANKDDTMPQTAVQPTKTKPLHKPYNRKYNRTKVRALAEMGVKATDIANAVDVHVSTITRYLEKINTQATDITKYKTHKADALTLNQLKAGAIGDLILEHWTENPEALLSQDVRIQKEVLIAANSVKTYDHNSERLERNQSTQNVDVYAKVQEMETELRNISKLEAQLSGGK